MKPALETMVGLGLLNLVAIACGLWAWRPRIVLAGLLSRRRARRSVASGLDAMIQEVEQAETERRAPEYGSEAWWQAWADGGGRLPQPATSGRPAAAWRERTRASAGQTTRSSGWHGA